MWKSSFIWWFAFLHVFELGALGFPASNSIPCAGDENCFERPKLDVSMKCKCDEKCITYGDCCYSTALEYHTQKNRRDPRLTCVGVEEESDIGAYMIDSCPENYDGPGEWKQWCLSGNEEEDPIMQAPAYDLINGVTYKNKFCAYCNDASDIYLLSFKLRFSCLESYLVEMNDSYTFIWERLQYHREMKSWVLNIDGEVIACPLTYVLPHYLLRYVRLCRPSLISSCPDSWRDESVTENCHSYIASVQTEDGLAFRNLDCAICNGYDARNVSCILDVDERAWVPESFGMLIDFNLKDGEVVGISSLCGEDYTYDPYFLKCRRLFCITEDNEIRSGRCD